MVATGFLTMLKYSVGKKEKSLALICDAEHSKIDLFSSIGVFLLKKRKKIKSKF
jgi:divalent metal cation (Fe/Co/Zn/Cd) transporter